MAKDINLEDLGIISLDQLGINTSNWQINVDDIYQLEYDRCHRKDVDFNHTREKTIGTKESEFASWGEIGNFDWGALTQIYSSVIFKNISSEKKHTVLPALTATLRAMLSAKDVLPIPGRAPSIIRSDLLRPVIIRSSSPIPQGMPM